MPYLKVGLTCLILVLIWIGTAVYGSFFGWWLKSVAPPGDTEFFSKWIELRLSEKTPAVSAVALISENTLAYEHFSESRITQDTLFPVASMSKWLAALAVMKLVETGQIDLDAPVENYLQLWSLPKTAFDSNLVTPRLLLSHMAGLGDGLGFGDYRADEVVPDLVAELDTPRGSHDQPVTISVTQQPGTEFRYSGGGYLVLELLVEEVSGQTFADFVDQTIFQPAAMSRSSYAYLGELDNVSGSFTGEGDPAPLYRYASAAATGLNSSVADLAKLVNAVSGDTILDHNHLRAMRVPHAEVLGAPIWGLGNILYAPTHTGAYVFGHDGGNSPAINSTVRINPDSGDAIIVLISGHPTLASDIGAEWVLWQTGLPDVLQTERALLSAVTPAIVGSGVIIMLCLFWLRRYV